jgi:hypothetical protein
MLGVDLGRVEYCHFGLTLGLRNPFMDITVLDPRTHGIWCLLSILVEHSGGTC